MEDDVFDLFVSFDFSWVLHEKPDFQGRTIALEEGGIELDNVWAESGAETVPRDASPMLIGSIRLAVWVNTKPPLPLLDRAAAVLSTEDSQLSLCRRTMGDQPLRLFRPFCRITASPASICLPSRRAAAGSRPTTTTTSRRARSASH